MSLPIGFKYLKNMAFYGSRHSKNIYKSLWKRP